MNLSDIFDLVFCTNMDYRPDKWEYAQREIAKVGLTPTRLPGVIYTGTGDTRRNGWIGCGLCHINGLKIAREQNKSVLMFEDDVEFINDYLNIISHALDELPKNFDMFYLGGNIGSTITQISEFVGKLSHSQATHAYGVSKNFLSTLLEDESRYYTNVIDELYGNYFIPRNNCYITVPMVAIQKAGQSDIEGRYVSYQDWMEQRFYNNLKRL